jgi:phosphopantetheinyl transferase (holo-ACP synthase)
LFEPEPTILRVGAYSVDPQRFAAIIGRHAGAGELLGVSTVDQTRQATEFAVKQAVLRALGAPVRLRADWRRMEVSQDADGTWQVSSRGPVRQYHEAHTLGHVDVTVSEKDGRITAFALVTRDAPLTEPTAY